MFLMGLGRDTGLGPDASRDQGGSGTSALHGHRIGQCFPAEDRKQGPDLPGSPLRGHHVPDLESDQGLRVVQPQALQASRRSTCPACGSSRLCPVNFSPPSVPKTPLSPSPASPVGMVQESGLGPLLVSPPCPFLRSLCPFQWPDSWASQCHFSEPQFSLLSIETWIPLAT